MKKLIFFLLLTIAISQLQAQSYLINFTGSGLSNTVDSVYVQNLVKLTELTMSGSDTLWLDPNVGINPLTGHNDNLLIYPNPLITTGKIEFPTSRPGNVRLRIVDAAGKVILQKEAQLPQGTHVFPVSGLKAGIYIVEVISNDGILTGRIIAAGGNTGEPTLTFESSNSHGRSALKSTNGIVGMRYDAGEPLLFKGTSGKFKRVVTVVPTHNQAVDFDFIACSDPDSNSYAVVTIGTQTWMAENLKTSKFNDASPIPLVYDNSWGSLTTPAFCVYDTSDVFKQVFGCLYNFYAVNAGNLCPVGWHAPTTVEWTTLTDYLGGANVAGGKLKEVGQLYWLEPNAGATNETGFSARGGGARYNGLFNYLGRNGYWWSSTEYDTSAAWYRYIVYNDVPVLQNNFNKTNGFYVRCVKD